MPIVSALLRNSTSKLFRYLSTDAPKSASETVDSFVARGRAYTAELRSSKWGVEAVFLDGGDLHCSQRWSTRELAVLWAEQERRAIESGRRGI